MTSRRPSPSTGRRTTVWSPQPATNSCLPSRRGLDPVVGRYGSGAGDRPPTRLGTPDEHPAGRLAGLYLGDRLRIPRIHEAGDGERPAGKRGDAVTRDARGINRAAHPGQPRGRAARVQRENLDGFPLAVMNHIEGMDPRRAAAEAEAMGRELRLVGFARTRRVGIGIGAIGDMTWEQRADRPVTGVHKVDVPVRALVVGQAPGNDPRRARHTYQVLDVDQ